MGLGGVAGVGVAYQLHSISSSVTGCGSPPHAAGAGHPLLLPTPALAHAVHPAHGVAAPQPAVINVPWHCLSDGFLSTLGPLVIGAVIGAVIGLLVGAVLLQVVRAASTR